MGSRGELNGSLEEQWSTMKERVKRTVKEMEEEREEKIGGKRLKGWWDKECREEKRKVRKKSRV